MIAAVPAPAQSLKLVRDNPYSACERKLGWNQCLVAAEQLRLSYSTPGSRGKLIRIPKQQLPVDRISGDVRLLELPDRSAIAASLRGDVCRVRRSGAYRCRKLRLPISGTPRVLEVFQAPDGSPWMLVDRESSRSGGPTWAVRLNPDLTATWFSFGEPVGGLRVSPATAAPHLLWFRAFRRNGDSGGVMSLTGAISSVPHDLQPCGTLSDGSPVYIRDPTPKAPGAVLAGDRTTGAIQRILVERLPSRKGVPCPVVRSGTTVVVDQFRDRRCTADRAPLPAHVGGLTGPLKRVEFPRGWCEPRIVGIAGERLLASTNIYRATKTGVSVQRDGAFAIITPDGRRGPAFTLRENRYGYLVGVEMFAGVPYARFGRSVGTQARERIYRIQL